MCGGGGGEAAAVDLSLKLERGACLGPQASTTGTWGLESGRFRPTLFHFLLTGSVALSVHAVCLRFSFLICKMGMLTSTSQGCCERKTSPSTDSAVMPKLHKE